MDERDRADARAFGAAFVKALGPGAPTWEASSPQVRDGWAGRHDQLCTPRHDWRLTWPAVREGWREAGGAFDSPVPDRELPWSSHEAVESAPGAHVYDAFGEPAGRVKTVRDEDFLLARPLARDVYVPFSAIRWPGRTALRIGVPNGRIGAMGWERPGLIGTVGRRPSDRRGPGSARDARRSASLA
jgi:hypothetical protein